MRRPGWQAWQEACFLCSKEAVIMVCFLRSSGYISATNLPLLLENKALLALASCAFFLCVFQDLFSYKVQRGHGVYHGCVKGGCYFRHLCQGYLWHWWMAQTERGGQSILFRESLPVWRKTRWVLLHPSCAVSLSTSVQPPVPYLRSLKLPTVFKRSASGPLGLSPAGFCLVFVGMPGGLQ